MRQIRVIERARSVELNKSLTANDEQVPVATLFNSADIALGNYILKLIANKMV